VKIARFFATFGRFSKKVAEFLLQIFGDPAKSLKGESPRSPSSTARADQNPAMIPEFAAEFPVMNRRSVRSLLSVVARR
jgi:hypothetical protein